MLRLQKTRDDKINVILINFKKEIEKSDAAQIAAAKAATSTKNEEVKIESFTEKFQSTLKSSELIRFYIILALFTVFSILVLTLIYIFGSLLIKRRNEKQDVVKEKIITQTQTPVADDGLGTILSLPTKKPILSQQTIPVTGEDVEAKLFSYVDDTNVYKVSYLLKNESSKNIIAVLNFLQPELAAMLFQSFSLDEQKKLVLEFSNEFILSPKEVRNLSTEIQVQMEFLAGGNNFTTNMFDCLSHAVSGKILEEVGKDNKVLADKIAKSIYTFEDIQFIEKRYIQYVVKQLGVKDFSIAISQSEEIFRNKIFNSLSDGVIDLIKQSLQLLKKQPHSKVLSSQHAIVQILRTLYQEGLIPEKASLTENTTTID